MKGLTAKQAKEALVKYGPNILPKKSGYSALKIFINQLKNPFSVILIIAILLSLLVGDALDSFLIAAILILNIALGFWQEYKASKELEALRSFEVLYSRVYRDGKEVEIPSNQIVLGDVVVLEAGYKIPSDGKILENFSLQVNESALTGESLPIVKTKKEGENLVFFGTSVVSGRAKFEVLATASHTRFGQIAQTLVAVEEEKTPLEVSLSGLIKSIGISVLIVTVLLTLLRVFQGFETSQVLLGSIALMVAAVPEGLPAVVTIILAIGVRRMYQRKALVRKMISVESLGAATVILSDKTGTLTKNEMRVLEIESVNEDDLDLLKCAVLCNSANLVLKEDGGSFDILGDTTEGALLLWAKSKGQDIDLLRSQGKLVEEIPFSLQSRKMTTIWEHQGKRVSYIKGAPEVILKEVKLSGHQLDFWDKTYRKMASRGLRVLGFKRGETFLGLIGIADQIREEVKTAVRLAKNAGIKVVMLTGDNELTAKEVAEAVGILQEGDEILTGIQLQEMDDSQLVSRLESIKVFARITPEDKLRLVKVYQGAGEVVAVTGDGVNDSLALKQAQVGVSMGKSGTDVAKEASDIVLLDDNFQTLVLAVEQGRVIYSNILKVVKFLLTGNLSEVLFIAFASLFAFPAPLLPVQILWINFVTDGLPALSLGFDSPSAHIMKAPPRKGNNILNRPMVSYILTGGVLIALACLLVFWFTLNYFGLQKARAATFTTMVILQMCLPFVIRRHHSITSNRKLLASVLLMLALQALILTYPPLSKLFGI